MKIIDDKNIYPSTINIDKRKTISDVLYYNKKFVIGYAEGGLAVYDTETKEMSSFSNYPQNARIFTMYANMQDILWVGTDGQGLYQIYDHKSAFNTVKTNYPVRAFCEYTQNEILVGTKGEGILLFNKKDGAKSNFASTNDGLLSNSVYALAKNKNGDVFIGTEGKGINIIQDRRVYPLEFPKETNLPMFVYSIAFTNNDRYLWLGTSGLGLFRVELEKVNNKYIVLGVKQYSTSNDKTRLNKDIIYSIEQGNNSNELWVSTRGDGLFLFDIARERFTNLDHLNKHSQISSDDVLSLQNNTGTLWVGTGYGLNKIDLNSTDKSIIKTFTQQEGLANNTIHGILCYQDVLWVSSNLGLSKINLIDNAVTNYRVKDGLQNDEFSDGAYYQDSEGVFYFGGIAGFNYFKPSEILLRNYSPSIRITDLKIFNNSVNIDDKIKNNTLFLGHNEAYTNITFIADDFINNENCEYAYRFANLSSEWINNEQNPTIALTNLAPGDYKLQVRVTNGDRIWGNYIYTLNIKVAYPWWLSLPAIIAYVLLALIIGYVIFLVIRNRVRLNKKLLLENIEKQNQKKIHESKLDFFTNVAHEFFTPLTLIYGPAQHLLEKEDLDDYTRRYAQIIKNNSERMRKLIDELMDFRKVESGYTPIYPEKVDVKLLIDYISDNYTEIAQKNGIDFRVTASNASVFTTDRNSIEKVIFNLISNAFKYTPAKGYIEIALNQTENKLNFLIENSGRGLTEKQQKDIFNKFKILETTQLENSGSTGIGLSLVKGICELLGGSIVVRSELNQYVEFEVTIPPLNLKSGENALLENTEVNDNYTPIIKQKDITILIVEDEKDIRELLRNIIEPYYNVQEAYDGQNALDIISENTPDIIISDILMPNVDGMELIKQLKENALTSYIPVINISAKNSLDDKITAYEQGSDLYITKPFHPRHILATIQGLIRKQSSLKKYYTSGLSMMTVKDGIQLHQEDETILNEIISYIEKHIDDENLNPNSIADALGISKASLYRKMQELAKKTPSEFVRSIRLNYAAQLLKSSKMTVQEIMFKSGFSNKSYFYREFAKQFNSSPNEYRQKK